MKACQRPAARARRRMCGLRARRSDDHALTRAIHERKGALLPPKAGPRSRFSLARTGAPGRRVQEARQAFASGAQLSVGIFRAVGSRSYAVTVGPD